MPHQSKYWPYEIDALLAKIPLLQNQVNGVTSLVFVSSTSQMTDTSRAYVNTTDGQWYLYENGGWAAKGQYGGVAVDDTLSTTGAAADAKRAGVTESILKAWSKGIIPAASMNQITDTTRVYLHTYEGGVFYYNPVTAKWETWGAGYDGYIPNMGWSVVPISNSQRMTDPARIYLMVHTGKWWYHNGTSWVVGGDYENFAPDKTLLKPGWMADAKATGDAIAAAKALIPAVDATLSIAGAAADAKATGDAIPAVDATLTVEGAAADAHVTGTFIGAIRDELAHKIGDSGTQEMEGPLIITDGSDGQYTELARYDDTNQFHILNTGRQGQTASLIIDSNHIGGAGPIGLRTQDTAGKEQFYAIFGTHNKHSFIDPQLKFSNWAADAEVTGARINAVRAAIPTVDAALTTQGAAADAKATGAALQEQSEEIADLRKTVRKIGVTMGIMSPESWEEIQLCVRNGHAAKFFSVGDQLQCQKGAETLTWDVIGIDHDTPADPQYTHSLTLQLHDCWKTAIQFDEYEDMYIAENGLEAGTYNIAIGVTVGTAEAGKTYAFTLSQTIPAGGAISGIRNMTSLSPANWTITTYNAQREGIEYSVPLTESADGTNLGTLTAAGDGTLNSIYRVAAGSSNYTQSALRQWLNSAETAGFWKPQTKYDTAPLWAETENGWMYDLDPDFLAAVGKTSIVTVRNRVSDGAGSDTLNDWFFLPSRTEVYGGNENNGIPEGTPYPYYSDYSSLPEPGLSGDTNRIKNMPDSVQFWYLRTPSLTNPSGIREVSAAGAISAPGAVFPRAVSPICNII